MNNKGQIIFHLFAALIYFFMWVPMLVLIIFSFNASEYGVKWTNFTFKWYIELFNDPSIIDALMTSLKVAAFSVPISTVIGTLTAFALARFKFRGKGVYRTVLLIPMIMPGIVVGVISLSYFNMLNITLGLHTIIIAHITFSIPLATLVVSARMQRLDPTLEEAAKDLGADEITTTRKITIPLLLPGILSAALMCFPWSFNDYVITYFVAGVGTTTLPIHIFSMVRHGLTPVVNALGTIIILAPIFLLVFFQLFRQIKDTVSEKRGVSESA